MATKRTAKKAPAKKAGADSQSKGGRPRKVRIRSRLTAGAASTSPECPDKIAKAIVEAAGEFGPDDLPARVWRSYASYLAHADASKNQVGLADELRDLMDIEDDAQRVRRSLLTVNSDDSVETAVRLAERLANFPNVLWSETTTWERGEALTFEQARVRLHETIWRVAYWPQLGTQHAADLDVISMVCARLRESPPRGFTKRPQDARRWFQKDLETIYAELIHPERLSLWEQNHDPVNDPPPAPRHRAFAIDCMKALGVPFESKTRGK